MWRTRITRQLGIKQPFVGAGMAIVGGPELTAAVSNAGGVGLFCLGPGTPAHLDEAIKNIRSLTKRPFGVDFIVENTSFGPATTDEHIEVAARMRVPLCVFFWNPPEPRWVETLRRAGAKLWGTVHSVEGARQLEALGMDALIVQSFEAGGHVKANIGAMSFLPAVARAAPKMPLVAAGGIVDGRSAAAAFALGADAVCVGTRLVASRESLASDEYKRRLLAAQNEDTTVTTIFGPEWPNAPMRVVRNRAVARAERGETAPAGKIGETTVFGQPYDMPACSAVLPTRDTVGDHEEMCIAAGAGVGAVCTIQSTADIVADIVQAARHRLRQVAPSSW